MMILFGSCTKDEDTTPSNADKNLFIPADDDNSRTAGLRREFYSTVGSYLLFNDTLKHVNIGTDIYGNTIWNTETVDLGYTMVGSGSSSVYTFNYITDYDSQSKAIQIVKNKLIPHLGKNVPYSILLVDSITVWQYLDGELTEEPYDPQYGQDPHPSIVVGERCSAISLNGGQAYTNDTYFKDIFQQLVEYKLSQTDVPALTKFYSYCDKYYSIYKSYLGYNFGVDDDLARSLGYWKDWNIYYFPPKDGDLSMFAAAICNYSTAQVEKEYAAYPLVIEKFKILKAIAVELGFKFDD